MNLVQITRNLDLKNITEREIPDQEVLLACCSDVLSDVMAHAEKKSLWITHLTNENVLAIAFFKELAGVIFPEKNQPDESVIEKAKEKNILLFSSCKTAFDIAGQLYEHGLRGRS